jgi:putative endopeptidase
MRRCLLALAACAAFLHPVDGAAVLDVAGLDRSVDPCVDFYGFVNRRWVENTAIPEDRPRWGSFDQLDERNMQVLKSALDDALKRPQADGTGRAKTLRYYASGLDVRAIEEAGLAPLKGLFDRIAGIQAPRDLPALFARLQSHGIDAPLQFAVRQDLKDGSRYLPELHQAGLGLPERDAYFRDDARSRQVRETYRRHVARILELAGETPQEALAQVETIFAFESQLARAAMTPAERRDVDKTYNVRSLSAIVREAPGFDWPAYFAALGTPGGIDVNVTQPRYVVEVARMAREKPIADWRAYLHWHVLRASASRLPKPFAQAHFDFEERFLKGVKTRPPRWREVVVQISGRVGSEPMAHGLGQIFVERAFPPGAKSRALALVANVKAALGERLETLEWMTPETRAKAREKLAAMGVKIGYPERWRDLGAADVGPYAYAENWLRGNEFRHRRDLARIGRPVDRDEWFASPHIVNAFYNGRLNEIVFPAGILRPPFFDPAADDAVNYGGIGAVIGHEITHGFDDRGRRFDAKGNLHDWWTAEDARRYLERAKRIERQFDGFIAVDGIPVNGKLTLGENISDLGGVKIAYLALQKALGAQPQAPIEGLTADQRFFMSFGTIWRARYSDEQERLLLRTDGHSPPRFRVNGPLTHMPEFARAFSCDATKTLAAEADRAEIW